MRLMTRRSYQWHSQCPMSAKDYYEAVLDMVTEVDGYREFRDMGDAASEEIKQKYADISTEESSGKAGLFMQILAFYYFLCQLVLWFMLACR